MDGRLRRVVSGPLADLWGPDGRDLGARLVREGVDAGRIKELLRLEHVRFVLADAGGRLRWVDGAERYGVWKTDVQPHLYEPARPFREDYPGEHYYDASEWALPDGSTVVLFWKCH